MVRKPTIYRRKLKGSVTLIFFMFVLFIGVFGALFGTWFFFYSQFHLISPLPQTLAQKKSASVQYEIQSLCTQLNLHCTKITLQKDGTIQLMIDTDEEVILSSEKDIHTQISSLQLTIAHLTIEGKRFHRLDFRFDKPVISY